MNKMSGSGASLVTIKFSKTLKKPKNIRPFVRISSIRKTRIPQI